LLLLLIVCREYGIRTHDGLTHSQAQINHLKPLGQFSLILSRLELEYHSYQKCALPVKLKNLKTNKK
jgi:hypothetical protein